MNFIKFILRFIYLLLFVFLLVGCVSSQKKEEVSEQTEAVYKEKHRPQVHFSPKEKWMNDPNGMVFYRGEYHLFYQYYPEGLEWGPMHWGHAISKDLIRWTHMPIALYPDSLGVIFSGSAVVDKENTSGFGTAENPPMVAIYTYHDMEGDNQGRSDIQSQAIAYSLDNGRNWTKYEKNPVLKNQGIRDFRDPKVLWHGKSKSWVMILAAKDHVELYGSKNLKSWNKLSDFGLNYGDHGGVWECPDIFPIAVEGDTVQKWVMLVSIGDGSPNGGSGTQYFVGDFDGKKFTCDTEPAHTQWVDYGMDNYAGVTYSGIDQTDGRRIFVGWMSNWKYARDVPTFPWRSAMTLPRTLSLKNDNGSFRLASLPVKELATIYYDNKSLTNTPVKDSTNISDLLKVDLSPSRIDGKISAQDFVFTFYNKQNQQLRVGYKANTNQFYVDRSSAGVKDFSKDFHDTIVAPRLSEDKAIKFTFVKDVSSIEVFFDDGRSVMTNLFFPDTPFDQLSISGSHGLVVDSLSVTSLQSIW